MIKVSAVSYSNTLPFKFGLENSKYIRKNAIISYDNPAECANKLINNQADLGLIPVGALNKVPNVKIISDYCLASKRYVNSVLLMSDVPLNEIQKVILDYQSITSVKMLKIIAEKYWQIKFKYCYGNIGYENKIGGTTAGLVIGDRAMNIKNDFNYAYDIAYEWYKFTGLNPVFAVWATTSELHNDFINEFNKSLKFGVNNISLLLNTLEMDNYSFDIKNYLFNCIDYNFDAGKQQFLDLFLSLSQDL